ncbi:MAG: lytic transglycosylase domain-containing protein [Alphaproteobacteria bacterium]|nr:lytic transglycosylase domain-containing protein [Alphaproteobacteria bacterium]
MAQNFLASILAVVTALFAPSPERIAAAVAPAQERPYAPQVRILSAADAEIFPRALAAARNRDGAGARALAQQMADPTARKLIEWAVIDVSGRDMSFAELEVADRAFAAWPRAESRRAEAEAVLAGSYAAPQSVLAWFDGREPLTAQGAFALADALSASGREQEAVSLVRRWWTGQSFEADVQTRALARWSPVLTTAHHDQRLEMLILGPHGPATRAMLDMASPDSRAVAQAVMSLCTAYAPDAIIAGLSPSQAAHPAVVLERVRLLRAQNRQSEGFALLAGLPPAPSHEAGQDTLWSERRNWFLDALQRNDWRGAYGAMAGHGFPGGERKVDAEFFAGWVALTKLNDPARAAQHFEALRTYSSTPITQGRALYWLGRAAEARGDAAGARAWYEQGARHIQTFYGQLAAEKAGVTTLALPADPVVAETDRARFEADEVVRATRILGEANEQGLMRVFAYHLDDRLPEAADLAQLMDLVLAYGDRFGSMMVGRAASQRGFLMPERQYPIRIPPEVAGAAPLPFTLAITRQESSFDPMARSSADARGMMQFLPSTASGVARRLGLPWSADRLWDPDYNMSLGSYHLAELTGQFGGSMLLATVGYNAGPARPPQWIARCGDPRGRQVDPVDFIECAPFTETRNYMMRVMENMSVYKARLAGGSAPLTLSDDLARGAGSGPIPYDQLTP